MNDTEILDHGGTEKGHHEHNIPWKIEATSDGRGKRCSSTNESISNRE